MNPYLIAFFLLFYSQASYSAEIKARNFKKTHLLSKIDPSGGFTYPVALLYSNENELVKNVYGKKLYDISNYSLSDDSKLGVLSPSLDVLLETIGEEKRTSKPTIIYVDMINRCPPCITLKKKFDEKVRKDLSQKFEIIELNVVAPL